ncbi:MAG: hypothetical protein KDJ52_00860 [Anaerolineae bacterium]|nr:hypothetical protein [Anaerolineae bacterium]
MKFLPLIDLRLTHSYYADSRCLDFLIEPTPTTHTLLKNHRCVIKSFPNGIRILTAVTADGVPFIPLATGTTFTFHLRLQNPDFALFTDLTEIGQVAVPLYTNAGMSPANSMQLALTSRQAWATESFVVAQPSQEDRFTLRGRPLAKLQPTDFTVEGLGPTTTPTHYEAKAKIITINSSSADQGDSFKLTYATTPHLNRGVFADVEIHYTDSLPEIAEGGVTFEIAFTAKKARWKYYVIVDKTDAQFHIEDKAASPLVFSDENRTDLNHDPDPSDDIAKTLAKRFPQMQRLRFVSDDLIACQQQARKSLQLRLNGDQVLRALPNPPLQNYATIDVTRNGNVQKEDTLFQIIKYFTHQFQAKGG